MPNHDFDSVSVFTLFPGKKLIYFNPDHPEVACWPETKEATGEIALKLGETYTVQGFAIGDSSTKVTLAEKTGTYWNGDQFDYNSCLFREAFPGEVDTKTRRENLRSHFEGEYGRG